MGLNEEIISRTLPFQSKLNQNIRITCPSCSHKRKGRNQREPVLSVLIKSDRLIYDCKHCGINGCAPLTTTPPRPRLSREARQVAEDGKLGRVSREYLTASRKIDTQVLEKFGVFST